MKLVVWIRTQLRIKANQALHRSRGGQAESEVNANRRPDQLFR